VFRSAAKLILSPKYQQPLPKGLGLFFYVPQSFRLYNSLVAKKFILRCILRFILHVCKTYISSFAFSANLFHFCSLYASPDGANAGLDHDSFMYNRAISDLTKSPSQLWFGWDLSSTWRHRLAD